MFLKQLKRILRIKDEPSILKSKSKIEKWTDNVSQKLDGAIKESYTIAGKLKDLHKTQYDLGCFHLKNNNLKEAIFRFKIVRKFWPDDYKNHLKLIYSYFLNKDERNADKAIQTLNNLNPNLKSKIEEVRIKASFRVKVDNDKTTDGK